MQTLSAQSKPCFIDDLLWGIGASSPLWAPFHICKGEGVDRIPEVFWADSRLAGLPPLPCPLSHACLRSEVVPLCPALPPTQCGSPALGLPPSGVSFCPRKSQFAELGAYVDGNVEKYFNHSSNLCL